MAVFRAGPQPRAPVTGDLNRESEDLRDRMPEFARKNVRFQKVRRYARKNVRSVGKSVRRYAR